MSKKHLPTDKIARARMFATCLSDPRTLKEVCALMDLSEMTVRINLEMFKDYIKVILPAECPTCNHTNLAKRYVWKWRLDTPVLKSDT